MGLFSFYRCGRLPNRKYCHVLSFLKDFVVYKLHHVVYKVFESCKIDRDVVVYSKIEKKQAVLML